MQTSAPGSQGTVGAELGELIGNWRIVELLGTGGMSSVYLAERADGLFEQRAALKLMAPGDETRRVRFDSERQALARLEHPFIARIIDGGADAKDRPFLVMELVDGIPIDDWVGTHKPTQKRIVELLRDLCAALNHAHARLVLHRDIKPSNVLVTQDGKLRLVDFGIASSLDAASTDVATSTAMTPAFAAPEQLEGGAETSATDMFAVGCLAHLLIGGEVAKRGSDGGATVDAARIGDRDLAAIIARATNAEPDARYQSATAMREDLQAWLEKRPVDARQGGAGYRFERLLKRNPFEAALASIALLALSGGLIVSLILTDQAREQRDLAEDARADAEWSLDRSEYFSQATSAYADLMQRVFGESEDIERLTSQLLLRVGEVQARADEDPETAAFVSFAAGRHFLFRNDYKNSVATLEPWVEGAYGPERFRMNGKQLLAIAYRQTGRLDESIELEREVELQMRNSLDANTPDHAAVASYLGLTTGDPAALDRGKQVVTAALENSDDQSVLIFLYNQLAKLHEAGGNIAPAYEAMQEAVRIIDADELGEISGQDTGRLNLVVYELFHSEDLERASALLDKVFADAQVRGPSSELARATWYRGEIARRRGNLDEARAYLDEALPLATRFVGEGAPLTRHIRLASAELSAEMGDHQGAASILGEAGGEDTVRHKLTRARLAVEREGASGATRALDEIAIAPEDVISSTEATWRYEALRADGVGLPALPSTRAS